MYGKLFASLFTGSLYGRPALTFAVWSYAIAHMRPDRSRDGACFVELHPTVLAGTFATTAEEVLASLAELEAPDPASRSSEDEGRRLVLESAYRGPGPMQFRVVNGASYRAIRDEEERRAYLSEAQRRRRGRLAEAVNKGVDCQPPSTAVNRRKPSYSQAEAEAEAEAEDIQGVQGGSPPPRLTAPPRSRRKPGDETPLEIEQANVVIDALSAAQVRLRPGARGYRHTAAHRAQIVRRLRDGTTVAELLEVVAAREAECRSKPEAVQWLNPTTPFRDSNWARSEAAVALAAPPAASSHASPRGGQYALAEDVIAAQEDAEDEPTVSPEQVAAAMAAIGLRRIGVAP